MSSSLEQLIIQAKEKKKKFVVVTGGVCSSLGKGVLVSSLGVLLQDAGYKVSVMKCDPYLNVDPGTMSPLEHGEVFVTADGAETDLDLGHYERTLNESFSRDSSMSSGQIFAQILEGERRGAYLGRDIQMVPHVVNAIKERILDFSVSKNLDIVLVEIGGTVGDMEAMVFLEALRQLKLDLGAASILHAHLSYVPFLAWTGEVKTKPTLHSVNELKRAGLVPDALFLRSDQAIDEKSRAKVVLMCGVQSSCVFQVLTVTPMFRLFFSLLEQGLVETVTKFFEGKSLVPRSNLGAWRALLDKIDGATTVVRIALVAKYVGNNDPYMSVVEAIKSAVFHAGLKLDLLLVNAEKIEQRDEGAWKDLKNAHGIVIPGGFDKRGAEGKIMALRWAREENIPLLGLCLGFQLMLVEAARSLLGIADATSAEFEPEAQNPVICLLDDQAQVVRKGGSMRLGEYSCKILPNSQAFLSYQSENIAERHRHRYEFNNRYKSALESVGIVFSGICKERNLIEIAEVEGHRFMVGTQFHPEFKSTYLNSHPLFTRFIEVIKCNFLDKN